MLVLAGASLRRWRSTRLYERYCREDLDPRVEQIKNRNGFMYVDPTRATVTVYC